MSASMDYFVFPPEINLESLSSKDEKVCVVSIIGKSQYNVHASKASAFNQVLDMEVFQGRRGGAKIPSKDGLECYYDSDNRVIYLHLSSVFDTVRLTDLCQDIPNEVQDKDVYRLLQKEEFHHAKMVLYLFSVSHIIVLLHPGGCFDITYVQLFRTVDTIRLKLQPFLTELLSEFPLPKEWALCGRPCSPRVLFVFDSCSLDYNLDVNEATTGMSKSRNQKLPPIRRLQHAIEDQIYRILRKSRIITNISNNSLFAVPANQEFVYVQSKNHESEDPVSIYINQLRNNCPINKDSESPRSRSYQTNRRMYQGTGMGDNYMSPSLFSLGDGENSFKEFLWQHIELALTKGFDDNVGRHPVPAIFQLTSSEVWFAMAIKLFRLMFADEPDSRLRSHFNTLKSLLETDIRFSDNRCNKVLPLAESAYQDGLPSHYTAKYHESKLAQAKRIYGQHARGPAFEKYQKQLEEACLKWWKNGRQLCEAVSLTGNHCVNPLHRIIGEERDQDLGAELPESTHCSQIKTRACCNCGRKQADKDDPFDHKSANYEFYESLEKTCCSKLEHVSMPVFSPSTLDIRAGQIQNSDVQAPTPEPPSTQTKMDVISTGVGSLSLALSLGQSVGSDIGQSIGSATDGHLDGQPSTLGLKLHSPTEPVKTVTRQHSTVEYLPGMIHMNSPSGLLPKYPSWSLCCLGKSALYSPTQGLDQPGFLHGSNYLLPWDMSVLVEREKWPAIGEGTSRKVGKQRRAQKDTSEVSLRAYLGEEYECPRGHRFFCSGPEKIIKVSSTSTVKDNANKLLTMDMPLYCPCHCRSTKGFMAQLMRVYVVTPEGPVTISLNPFVRPGPTPCPAFNPGTGAVDLSPGGIWILRLPYIYMGPNGPYSMPGDPQQLSQCRLLRDIFTYKDLTQPGDT